MSGNINTDVMDFEGAVKPTSVEKAAYEPDLFASRTCEIPTNLQARFVYDSDGNCTYAGYAPRALATSSTNWLLQKFTWVAGNCTVRLIAYDSWDNYLTASYA